MTGKISTIVVCLLLFSNITKSQVFTQSKLPIVKITSDGEIVDDPKVGASMKIIYRGEGQITYVSDENNPAYLNYNGRIEIEFRGSSSQALPKKAYGFETRQDDNSDDKNVSLLGMPSENDWILNGLAWDPSLLHDYLAYNLSREIGQYAVRTIFCEVIINNDYRGVYVLQEKIKDDSERLNITEILPTDNATPNVTGGYIIKSDKTTGGDPVAFVMDGFNETVDFVHDTPDPSVITDPQKAYIKSVFDQLAAKAQANNASVVDGFPSIIDIPTFIDYMLVNEIGSCVDAYKISTFFHQDRNGKLRAGPVWDFNYGFGLVGGGIDGRSGTTQWQFQNGNNEGPKFFRQIFENNTYRCHIARRWNQLIQPGMPFNIDRIDAWIDSMKSLLAEAAVRENQRWGTIPDYTGQINFLKTFIRARSNWITANISPSGTCPVPVLPELVINEIMYNAPAGSAGPSDDQEYIEIKNRGNAAVNLSGIYFSGLGLTYQFPPNTTLGAGSILVIASNPANYTTKFGSAPFGQFTRKLSNKSQKLVLADAFGNVIDVVQYFDSAPWPTAADGGGKALELISPELDNNVGSNWTARLVGNGSPGVDNTGALPVTLVRFTGVSEGGSAVLSWDVVDEINVNQYEIEQSVNGKNFERVGAIPASQVSSYQFVHRYPVSGVNYYRLKSVDNDNTFSFSKIVAVDIETGSDLVIYPNPAFERITIRPKADMLNKSAQISLVNVNGKLILKKKFKNMSANDTVDVSKIPVGQYVVRIECEGQTISRQVTVAR